MNSEEKNLNTESNVEVFSLEDNTNEATVTNQGNVVNSSIDTSTSEMNSVSNVFMYTDSSVPSMTETPVENQDATNTFAYTEEASSSESIPVVDSVQNSFSYAEMPTSTVTEMSSDNFTESVEPVQNAFAYTETPVALEVPVEGTASNVGSAQSELSYTDLKDMPQDSVEETPKYNPPAQTNSVSNYSGQGTDESKGNFKFMLVFAIIMLAIIIALPYIAGYK